MNVHILSITLIVFASNCLANDEEDVYTIQYNADNFGEEIGKRNHFVMFYAPW